jgi:branched-chain amino acid transport system substrate-binding protein
MNKKLLIGIITAVIVAAGVIYITNSTQSVTSTVVTKQQSVKHGAVLALTGYAVNEGTQLKNGIELAKSELAKNGVELSVEYYDDATDPKKTVAGIEFMHSKGISTIIGPTWSFQVSAGIPTLEKYGMIAFSSDESSDIIEDTSNTKNVFYGMPASGKVETPTADWMKKNNVKKVAIMYSNSGYGQVHADAWARAAKSVGAQVVISEKIEYANEATDVPALVIKAKKDGVDAILWTGGETGIITLIKKMNEIGYLVPVLGTEGAHNVVRDGRAEQGNLKLYSLENTMNPEFVAKYVAMFGVQPQAYAQAAYDHTMMAAKAEIARGNSSIHDYVLAHPYKGYAGSYDFDQKGDILSGSWNIVTVTK